MIIGGKRSRLHREYIFSPDVFLDLDKDFHIGKAADHAFAQWYVTIGADGFGKGRIAVPSDQLISDAT